MGPDKLVLFVHINPKDIQDPKYDPSKSLVDEEGPI